jgi:toxin ParE1/3/4
MKASRLREAALQDIDDALDYYLQQAPHMLGALQDSILQARKHIEEFPSTGSQRYHTGKKGDALRFWLLSQFPYALFYFDRADTIDIVRMLHQASDIPQHLEH